MCVRKSPLKTFWETLQDIIICHSRTNSSSRQANLGKSYMALLKYKESIFKDNREFTKVFFVYSIEFIKNLQTHGS